MNINEVYDCLATRPYADEGDLLNDWVNHILKRVSWKLFEHQENMVYMANERPDGVPLLKDGAIDYINSCIDDEFHWLRHYIISHILMSYRLGHIDLGEEGEWYLRDDLGDEAYAEWESRARKAIYIDYANTLGEEGATAYFEKIGRSGYKNGDISDLDLEVKNAE